MLIPVVHLFLSDEQQQQQQQQPRVPRRLYRSTCVSWHLQLRTEEDIVGAKFDGNQRIRIREKTLEFSSTVLSALFPCLYTDIENTTELGD